jgi:hypothetical protein
MGGLTDRWMGGATPGVFPLHPGIQLSHHPASFLWLWLMVAVEIKNPRPVFSRGFLLNHQLQQAPTASPTTTTTPSVTACMMFFNIAD